MDEKRYQVFVSSTYEDLREERQQVIQALLELGCIPAGMELFPAADADQWTLIRKVIDECDYYIVLVAGRYGTTDDQGTSYTEKEYRYAVEKGKPVIGFLHEDPSQIPVGKSENTAEGKQRLVDFRAMVERKMVRYWTDPVQLGGHVSRSMALLMRTTPSIGWVRADRLPSVDVINELERLRAYAKALEERLSQKESQEVTSVVPLLEEAPKGPGEVEVKQGVDERPIAHRVRLPATRQSLLHKFSVGGHEGFLTVGHYENGQPGEILIQMAKEGSTVGGLLNTFAVSVSLNLQYGIPLEILVKKFTHFRFEPSGMTSNRDIPFAKSITDYVFRWIGLTYLE